MELQALAQLEVEPLAVHVAVHDSARLGAIVLPGIVFTSASCIAHMSQKGVMKPVTSLRPDHWGEIVRYGAMRISPSGFTGACGGANRRAARTAIPPRVEPSGDGLPLMLEHRG